MRRRDGSFPLAALVGCIPISLGFMAAGWLIGTLCAPGYQTDPAMEWFPWAVAAFGAVLPWLVLLVALSATGTSGKNNYRPN